MFTSTLFKTFVNAIKFSIFLFFLRNFTNFTYKPYAPNSSFSNHMYTVFIQHEAYRSVNMFIMYVYVYVNVMSLCFK